MAPKGFQNFQDEESFEAAPFEMDITPEKPSAHRAWLKRLVPAALATIVIAGLAAYASGYFSAAEQASEEAAARGSAEPALLAGFYNEDFGASVDAGDQSPGEVIPDVPIMGAAPGGYGSTKTVDGVIYNNDGSVNCCGGGGSCGYMHCPALGADTSGCVQPWAMPNGMDFETDCTKPASDTKGAADYTEEIPTWKAGGACDRSSGDPVHVYLGDGCFWHTQYDLYLLEREEPFARALPEVSSLVGYAGALGANEAGQVCYHHGPPGSDYDALGYTETVQVTLDGGCAAAQFAALVGDFFESGFQQHGTRMGRKDPQDYGPQYRINIGFPGGMAGDLFPLVQAANVHNMELREGKGGDVDKDGDYVVYVYDSETYPFHQGEKYHQFHRNIVLRREVPTEYLALRDAPAMAERMGRSACDN